jgi:hypothetical protein
MHLLPLPSLKQPISQERLRGLVTLSNSLRVMKKQQEKYAQSVLAELLDGVPIEEGPHIAEVVTERRGHHIKHKLKLR